MKNEFVPYDIALAMKELGFDEPCFGCYREDKMFLFGRTSDNTSTWTLAPLYQQAFRWFREEYVLDGKPEYFLNDWYCYIINDMKGEDNSRKLFTEFPTYEEAQDACLRKLIEIVKDEK